MSNPASSLSLPLSQLTSTGLNAFKKLVTAAPAMSLPEVEKNIVKIAGESGTASVVAGEVEVPVMPTLATRRDTAELVTRILAQAKIDAGPSTGQELLFSWLALIFLPAICKRTQGGNVATGKMYRYILQRSTTDSYRHLVSCPYWLYRICDAGSR
jgi:hypothetical protein